MEGWVRYSGGRLIYAGRITRAPFRAWTGRPEGRAAIATVAAGIRFALFGKERAARSRLWRALSAAARDEAVVATVQDETQAYLKRSNEFVYGAGLPRIGVDLHRLVVVPRVMLNAAAYRGLETKLRSQYALTALDDSLCEFFILRLIREIGTAIARAQPSPKRPLAAGNGWIAVGLNTAFVWRVPFNAPKWPGHLYMFELTRDPVTRATRKAIAANIRTFEESLPSLSRIERNEILRRASIVG